MSRDAVVAGLRYGGLAFLAGAVLGPVRELLLAPRIGGLPAALVEAAVMAVLLWFAARFALRRMPTAAGARVTAAVVALAVVLLAEATLTAALDATGLAAQRAPRGLAERAVGLPLLAWLVAQPLLHRRRGVADGGGGA